MLVYKKIFQYFVICLSIISFGNVDNGITSESVKSSDSAKGSIRGRMLVLARGVNIILPASNIPVQLYDPAIRKILMTTESSESEKEDQRGWFTFDGVTPGDYIIIAGDTDFSSDDSVAPHPVAVSVKAGLNEIAPMDLSPSIYMHPQELGIEELKAVLSKYPKIERMSDVAMGGYATGDSPMGVGRNYRLFTVCELLSLDTVNWLHSVRVVVIGKLTQTPDGSWLEGSCGNSVKAGDNNGHTWPDAIFVNLREGGGDVKKDFETWLWERTEQFGKDYFIKNYGADNNANLVAVAGILIVPDKFVFTKCDTNETCGFGYGPIAAPMRIDSWHVRYLNQQEKNTVFDIYNPDSR